MDRDTAEHFYAWLNRTVHESEQRKVEQQINALIREYPDFLITKSWPEMRTIAESV